MSTLDGGILNIANPSIAEDFAVPLSSVQWVVNAYMLVITASLLMFGRLGDYLGMEKLYTWGFIVLPLAQHYAVRHHHCSSWYFPRNTGFGSQYDDGYRNRYCV